MDAMLKKYFVPADLWLFSILVGGTESLIGRGRPNQQDHAMLNTPSERSKAGLSSESRGDFSNAELILHVGLILLVALLMFWYAGVGYAGSDDSAYIGTSRRWLENGAFVGEFFGDLRYPLILPIAMSVGLFGDSELSAAVPTLCYALGTVIVTYIGMRAIIDHSVALLAALMLSLMPLLAGSSTTVSADICELFFIAVSLMTFLWGVHRRLPWYVFFVAGIAAGFGFMTRESAIALLALYGALFLVDFGGRRYVFWIMAAGFAAVFCAEMLFYLIMIGDPLHRLRLVAAAIQQPDPIAAVGLIDLSSGRVFNITPVLDPILLAVTHPQFGLIFPLAAGAAVWAVSGSGNAEIKLARVACVLGLLSFAVGGYVLSHLALLPRYFLVAAYASTIAVALWFRFGLWPKHKRICVAIVVVLGCAHIAGTMMANRSPLFAARMLTSLAQASNAMIHTDPETVFRGGQLFAWGNAADKITSQPPGPNDLFLFNPKFSDVRTERNRGIDMTDYRPRSDWIVERKFVDPPSVFARTVDAVGLSRLLPSAIVRRIEAPNPPVTLYRLPTSHP